MRRSVVGMVFLLAVACRSSGTAQEPQPTGAYTEVPVDQEDVRASAERAVILLRARTGDDSLTLERIDHAEQQVVAGLNTRMTLLLSGASGERKVTVVVYRNLQDEESLTEVDGL